MFKPTIIDYSFTHLQVMLAYEEDRRDKATRDQREKQVREARIVAGLPSTNSPASASTSSSRRRTRGSRLRMPGSGVTLDGRAPVTSQDDTDISSPPPYPDDDDDDDEYDDNEEDV